MKRFSFLLFLFGAFQCLQAADFPKLSTGSQEYWYYLKFTQGSFVVGSDGEGQVCKAVIPTGRSAQLWKVERPSSSGYTFTNKLGLRLYVMDTSQGSEVRASVNPSDLYLFKINASGNSYTISPSTNTGQSFNSWGGMGLRNDIKLYSSSDANAPMVFLSESEILQTAPPINVVPYPSSVTMKEGVFNLRQLSAITCFSDSTALLARRLADDLQRTAGIGVEVKENVESATASSVSLLYDASITAEGYRLTVQDSGISAEASDYGGFFNALQTLRQLMPAAIFGKASVPDAKWEVPQLVINDTPAMSHRGFHFDISRHFFDKDEVKKLLDMASVYKLNRFHWHLTDDQGWRVEIPEYPLLTTVGAIRKASLTVYDPTAGISFYDDTEYGRGCYYTLDDLREIVDYARERNIQIIPEIDMPGHMTAAIVAYPELGCNPEKKIEVMTEGGVSRDVLNLGKDETIDFLKCVLGHLAEVFPYELIHIGGDECPTNAWQENADCQRRIKNEGLSGVNDLQPWLVEKLGVFLRENYGKNVVVWDELLANWKSNYTTKPVVMSWRGVDYARQAADKGLYSIMVPTRPLYFDLLQYNADKLEINCPYMGGYGNGSVNTLENVYNFNSRSTVSGREQFVIGTQANLWTESCTSNREAEYQYYPRLLALSEIAWLPNSKKNFISFYYRLQNQVPVLEAKEITYAPHYIEPKELTPVEEVIKEATDILSQSVPGGVGYPQSSEYDALQQALIRLQTNTESEALLDALCLQIQAYKDAPIVMPAPDRFYQIVSASTYFRNRFEGSTLYIKGKQLSIHYTPQTDLEEMWKFVPQDDGSYQIVSVASGNAITLSQSASASAKIDKETGSLLVIRKATKPAGDFTYIPGVVNIKSGNYNLYAQISGRNLTITSSLDSTLCYPGTWRIVEITDYRYWLIQLLEKAERQYGELSDKPEAVKETLEFLAQIITDSHQLLDKDTVSQQEYIDIAQRYAQYLTMSEVDPYYTIDPAYYYNIRNGYFTNYYAAANSSGNGILPRTLSSDDRFKWSIVKNDDGTVCIYNKQTQTAAYVSSSAEEQRLRLGSDYAWKLREITSDQNNSGVAIIDESGTYSWYINPNAWTYVLLKPYDWGASVWQFVKTDEEVPTGIEELRSSSEFGVHSAELYDLAGRKLTSSLHHSIPSSLPKGVYISNRKKIVKTNIIN